MALGQLPLWPAGFNIWSCRFCHLRQCVGNSDILNSHVVRHQQKSFSSVLGEKVSYVAVPHEASKQAMMGMGFPEFVVDGYIELNKGFAKGFADISTDNVELLSGHAARSVDDFVNDFRGYFGG